MVSNFPTIFADPAEPKSRRDELETRNSKLETRLLVSDDSLKINAYELLRVTPSQTSAPRTALSTTKISTIPLLPTQITKWRLAASFPVSSF